MKKETRKMWWLGLYHGGAGLGWLFLFAAMLIVFTDEPERFTLNLMTPWRTARIWHVIDGDTVILQNRERVRVKNCVVAERETDLGEQAYQHVKDNYLWKKVELVDEDWEKDKYGRTLARVVLGEKDLCQDLIAKDLAKPWKWQK